MSDTQQKALGTSLSWISVKDLKQARSLFEDTLGLKVTTDNADMGWLEFQGEQGGLIGMAQGEGLEPGKNAIIAIDVSDLDAMKAYLESKGLQFHGEVIEVPNNVKMAQFSDFDGNRFNLVEDLSKS